MFIHYVIINKLENDVDLLCFISSVLYIHPKIFILFLQGQYEDCIEFETNVSCRGLGPCFSFISCSGDNISKTNQKSLAK